MPESSITFYGATDSVTGSRHLLETQGKRVLVDCGLFQGQRELRDRNWQRFPVPPESLDAVVLTHAHLDHTGFLPRLVKDGYGGPVYCTPATRDLLAIMLADATHLQEEEAEHANRHGWSKHHPALPLYNGEDVRRTLPLLRAVTYEEQFEPVAGVPFRFLRAGHILGSAFARAETDAGVVLFSGDLGRYDQPIIPDPTPVAHADYLLLESTYGDRDHPDVDVSAELERIVRHAISEKGFVLVPSFAIERAQELLYLLNQSAAAGRIPRIPIYLDSPMAVSATPLFMTHTEDHDVDMDALVSAGKSPFEAPNVHYVHSRDESKALNDEKGPGIIIAGSGMANGGRIRHHLLNRVEDPRTTVLFVGYQAEGTPGRALEGGAKTFRAFGWEVPVRARMERLDALSGHADRSEILRWLRNFTAPPRSTFLVHGEPDARKALQARIVAELGWDVRRPEFGERHVL